MHKPEAGEIFISTSPADTERFAGEVLRRVLEENRRDGATVLALSGDLGAGKTTFTQAVARALGIGEAVLSPTFVIERVYELPESPEERPCSAGGGASSPDRPRSHIGRFRRLVHIDAYRLEGAPEILSLGWDDLVRDPHNLVLLEWPERVIHAISPGALWIRFAHPSGAGASENERRISVHETVPDEIELP